MNITNIQIDGFGVWSRLSAEDLSDNLTVFYGPNEAGKTTLLQFVRAVLYGFSPARRARYLPPLHGGESGGTLRVTAVGESYEIRRRAGDGEPADSLGDVSVVSSDGTMHGGRFLEDLLAGVDEATFNNVFAVGLRELQELGSLDDTRAAEHLYKLTTGLDRVSLSEVMRELESSRRRILAGDHTTSKLGELLSCREKLERQSDRDAVQARRWVTLAGQLREVAAEVNQAESTVSQLERTAAEVELAVQIHASWSARVELDRQIDSLGAAPRLPRNATARLASITADSDRHQRQLQRIKRQRAKLRRAAGAMKLNRTLCRQATRIEATAEQAPWMESLQQQSQKLAADVAQLESDLQAECRRLGLSPAAVGSELPVASGEDLSRLRANARGVRKVQQRAEKARAERAAADAEAAGLQRRLDEALDGLVHSQLASAIDDAGNRAAQFRRRIQIEERLDRMSRHRVELEEESQQLLERQVLSPVPLIWLGTIFVLGVTLILAGIFFSVAAALGWPLAVLGCGGCAIAIVIKTMLERNASRQLDDCNRQLQQLRDEIRQTKAEREEIDHQLPAGTGTLDRRLAEAEAELESLEQLLPIESQLHAAQQRSQLARQHVAEAESALPKAVAAWRTALRRRGLPEELTLRQLRQLGDGHQQIAQLRRQLSMRREEQASVTRALESLAARVDQLLQEAQIAPEAADPLARLRQLSTTWAEQRRHLERRRELRRRAAKLKRHARRYTRLLRKLQQARATLLAETGARDDQQLQQLAADEDRYQALVAARDDLSNQLAPILAQRTSEQRMSQIIGSNDLGTLENNWEELVAQTQDAQARLAQLHQRRGEITQEMKMLETDRQAGRARLELGGVDRQIQQAVHRWQTLAVTSSLLSTIRKRYETDRQPETLREASGYLQRMTDGQYTRIWTPLDEDALRVDDRLGQALPVEILSRGTREAVFLSLRLALASCYAKRGASLPLVLDDVLVNFDARRARIAAAVLRDFARDGHQLLLFTCHDHIRKAFKSVKVEVRTLPKHGDTARSALPPPATPVARLPQLGPAPDESRRDEEPDPEFEVADVEADTVTRAEVVEQPFREALKPVVTRPRAVAESQAVRHTRPERRDEPDLELGEWENDDDTWEFDDFTASTTAPPAGGQSVTLDSELLEPLTEHGYFEQPAEEFHPEAEEVAADPQEPLVKDEAAATPDDLSEEEWDAPVASRRSFTWESPERWWNDRGGAAA